MFRSLLSRIGSLSRNLSITNIIDKMQNPRVTRYFENNMPDYSEGEMKLSDEEIKNSIGQITTSIIGNFASTDVNAEDGLYLGTAGVAYMFYHLSKVPALRKMQQNYLQNAIEYLRPALQLASRYDKVTKYRVSFMKGNCSLYAIASAIYFAAGDKKSSAQYREKFLEIAKLCTTPSFEYGEELFRGRSGYICAALWLAKETNTPLVLTNLYNICHAIVATGRNYAKAHRCKSPLMYTFHDKEYLGAAHGISFILQMLISVPGYLETHPDDAKHIKESIDYVLSLQAENGNFPTSTSEVRRNLELVHWCHGAGGIVYLMARAYVVWQEEKYLESCKRCASVIWRKGLLRKGPGICHGIAGNGYAFLLLCRLTDNRKYLHRAIAFAQFMNTSEFKEFARKPDRPYSLYEGVAGTACFLADLTRPQEAHFPFSDVF